MALPIRRVVQHLREVALLHDGGELTDGELLDCFIAHGDESAFGALVFRHGPMVLGVCRRIVGNIAEAEDAFQATFLVLVRKAASVKPRDQVGSWLHGVAYRTAKKARAIQNRRRARETRLVDLPRPETRSALGWDEVRTVLDEELNRLPEKYRAPLVLCDLEGRTRCEAAMLLRIQEGALAYRLTTARGLLARRLTRRGVTLSGGGLAMILGQSQVTAAITASLAGAAVRAVTIDIAGAVTGTVPASILGLAEGVLQAMFMTKLKVAAAVLLTLAVAGGGVSVLVPSGAEGQAQAHQDNGPPFVQEAEQGKKQPKPAKKAKPNLAIEKKLDVPLDLQFEGPLRGALGQIAEKAGLNMIVSPEAHANSHEMVSLNLKNIPARTAIRLSLLGTGLSYVLEDNVLVVRSSVSVSVDGVNPLGADLRVFEVSDLVSGDLGKGQPPGESLVHLIKQTVEPTSWASPNVGIYYYHPSRTLIVRQRLAVCDEVEAVIGRLIEHRKKISKDQ